MATIEERLDFIERFLDGLVCLGPMELSGYTITTTLERGRIFVATATKDGKVVATVQNLDAFKAILDVVDNARTEETGTNGD